MKLEAVKVEVVRQALVHFKGNKTKTAEALDYSVRAVRNIVASAPELSEFRITCRMCNRERITTQALGTSVDQG